MFLTQHFFDGAPRAGPQCHVAVGSPNPADETAILARNAKTERYSSIENASNTPFIGVAQSYVSGCRCSILYRCRWALLINQFDIPSLKKRQLSSAAHAWHEALHALCGKVCIGFLYSVAVNVHPNIGLPSSIESPARLRTDVSLPCVYFICIRFAVSTSTRRRGCSEGLCCTRNFYDMRFSHRCRKEARCRCTMGAASRNSRSALCRRRPRILVPVRIPATSRAFNIWHQFMTGRCVRTARWQIARATNSAAYAEGPQSCNRYTLGVLRGPYHGLWRINRTYSAIHASWVQRSAISNH